MKNDFLIAITQLAAERNLPREMVLSAIETALVSAFRKETTVGDQNITVRITPNTGEVKVFARKEVVDEVQEEATEISVEEAQQYKPGAVVGDTVEFDLHVKDAGRIAAQTAKQVVMQRLRAAQSDLVYEEFSAKQGDMLSGVVQKVEPRQTTVDLGRAEGILPASEQPLMERYRVGQRIKVLIVDVEKTAKGPQVIVSRTHKDLLRRLFELEVPEIMNGTVVIRSVAREPGIRSKVAVEARQQGVDAVGACVGLRGIRIQNVVNELQGEKIDVVQWSKDPVAYLTHALSPAQVQKVTVLPDGGGVEVIVPDRQLSLAIGREGQNARLAARLTGYRIDIKSVSEALEEQSARGAEVAQKEAAPEAAVEAELPTAAVETPPEAPVASSPEKTALVASQPVPTVEKTEEEKTAEDLELEELLRLEEEERAEEEEPDEQEEEEEQPIFDLQAWIRSQTPSQDQPTLRFAEDILPDRRGGGRRRGKREKKRGGRDTDDAARGRRPHGGSGSGVETVQDTDD